MIGMVVGFLLHSSNNIASKDSEATGIEIHDTGKLTSPFLACDTNLGSGEYEQFGKEIEIQIRSLISKKDARSISVYFRDLQNGATFGVNEKEEFAPASLLKLPVLIGLLKYSENKPDTLTQKLTYTKKVYDIIPYYASDDQIKIGVTYTVDDLIRRMIVDSDNEALLLLQHSFPQEIVDDVYRDLGFILPEDITDEYMMSVKSYASFFRILYNASYLSRDMSEKALELLSNTGFTKGITNGIPGTITIAHKYGEREYTDTKDKQLHDCGIIYYPKHPYLLCIMSKGTTYEKLEHVIGQLSKRIFNEMNSRIKSGE